MRLEKFISNFSNGLSLTRRLFSSKGRAWLRSTLNEHSLERYFHNMLGNKTLLRYVKFLHYWGKTGHPSPEMILDKNTVKTFFDLTYIFVHMTVSFMKKKLFLWMKSVPACSLWLLQVRVHYEDVTNTRLRWNGAGRICNWLKNLTRHFVHTEEWFCYCHFCYLLSNLRVKEWK